MPTVKDYATGEVLSKARQVFTILESAEGPLNDTDIGNRLLREMQKIDPLTTGVKGASKFINESSACAVGARICREMNENSEFTETVFLDELADGMVKAGRAKYTTKEDAIRTLGKYPKNPLVVSKVSGKRMEVCRSCLATCVYWNMEKHGLKCLTRESELKSV